MHFASYYRWNVYQHLFGTPQSVETLLDIGCDDGGFADQLDAAYIVVVDRNRQALRGVRRGQPVCADGTHLPFRNTAFDFVILSDVIEHVEQDQALIEQTARQVNVGGTLWISTTAANFKLFPAMITPRAERSWGHVRKGYTPEQLDQQIGADFECAIITWPEVIFRHLYLIIWIIAKIAPVWARSIAMLCFCIDLHLRDMQQTQGHLYIQAVRQRNARE